MAINDNWHTLVEEYLSACLRDQVAAQKSKLSSIQFEILNAHGSDLLSELFIARAKESLNSLNGYASKDSWKVIEESESRVLIEIAVGTEIQRNARVVPFISTRILLMKPRGHWKIHDILQPCVRCNLISRGRERIPGKCFACEGTGELIGTSGNQCQRCEGTGNCTKCRAESYPGWLRASFLEPRSR